MIEVFDKTRRRVAILENAYAASESQKINSVWYFYFSLPYGDSKNEYCISVSTLSSRASYSPAAITQFDGGATHETHVLP